MKKIKKIFFQNIAQFVLLIFILTSCIEDQTITSTYDFTFDTANLLLQNFEGNGDLINNNLDPYFIEAEELFNNLDSYLIIDVRDNSEFALGRIEKSINVLPNQIVDYFKTINFGEYEKVVFVSSTGQKAAFCFSILKLLGYNNIYTLNFGLASWNRNFAQVWLNALDTQTTYFEANAKAKDNTIYGLPELENTELPQLPSFMENRAKEILQLNFDENNSLFNNQELSISWLMTDSLYYFLTVNMKGDIISVLKEETASVICYGTWEQYILNGYGYLVRSHPSYAWLYKLYDGTDETNFQSNVHLQNIPLTNKIIIYSFSGQRSAMAVAYLRMLGYNASSLVFGSCNIQYDDMFRRQSLIKYTFTQDKIKNYEYVTD